MSTDNFDLNNTIEVLERTPATLNALLSGLSDHWIFATEGAETWSPFYVVGHLVHLEQSDWITRARHILSGKSGPFESINREANFDSIEGKPLAELLIEFGVLRARNLAALVAMNLSSEDLDRTSLHPSLGQVTLKQLLATWSVHDLDHITQIARTMAKSYTDATGPWNVYLSVLRDRVG